MHPAWIVLGALALAMLGGTGLRSVFGVYIKPLEADFGWSRAALSGAAAVSLLVFGAVGPLAGPTQVLEYLGRYTHRVAISNERLVSHTDGVVRFRWRDYADGDRVKIMTLAAEEFIRRFLLHVVPGGFVRIRHFGFLANRTRRAKLARCRALLAQPAPAASAIESVPALMRRLTGIDIERCPVCQQGRLHVTEILTPTSPATRCVPVVDTS